MASSLVALMLMLLVLNLLTYVVFAYDKGRARRGAWRIPERQLFLLMAFGGSICGWAAMVSLRHKNRKTSFRLVATFIISVQLILAIVLLRSSSSGVAPLP